MDARGAARRCFASLEKQGLAEGAFATFDIGVNRDGSLGHLNVGEDNVPSAVTHCLRAAVDGVSLPVGPKAVIRYKISY